MPAIKVFSTSVSTDSSDPLTYLDAMSCKDALKWRNAMQEEIQSIIDHKTWELSDLPSNRQVIGTKWVLKKKRDGNNNAQSTSDRKRILSNCWTRLYRKI